MFWIDPRKISGIQMNESFEMRGSDGKE